MAAASVIASAAVLLRDMSISKTLGRTQETDTLLAGMVVATTLAQLVPSTFQASAFAVAVETKLRRGPRAMQELLGATSARFVLLALALAVPLVVLAHPIASVIARSANVDALAAVFPLLAVFATALALTELGKSVLILDKRYVTYAIIGGFGNLLLGGLIVLRAPATARSAAILADVAFVVALAVTWTYLLSRGLVRMRSEERHDTELRRIYRQAPPTLGAGILTIGMSVVDQIFTISLGAGSYATLQFAQRWPLFATQLPALALGQVLLRSLAEDAVRLDARGLRSHVRHTAAAGFGLGLLAALGGLVIGPFIVRATLQGGQFTAADADAVISVQNLLFLQAPFYIGGIVYLRVLNALRLNVLGFVIGGVMLGLNALFDWLFTRPVTYGVHGIALATVLVYVFSGLCLVVVGELVLRGRIADERRSAST